MTPFGPSRADGGPRGRSRRALWWLAVLGVGVYIMQQEQQPTSTTPEVEVEIVTDGSGGKNGGKPPLRRAAWILGWLFLASALAVGGYILVQQWTESAAADRGQEQLAERWEERSRQAEEGASPEVGPRPTTETTVASTITTPDEQTALAEFEERDDIPVMLAPLDDRVQLAPVDPSPDLVREFAPAESDALGRISIPAIDLDWAIVEGVSARDLAKAPGHMPGTAVPGQIGNAVISGHRTTNGAPFGDLDLLEPGDEIRVDTLIGTHTYEVVGVRIVAPTELWVVSQWRGSWLTLTTCHPKFSAAQRLIVFAHLVDGPNAEIVEQIYPGPYEMPEPGQA